MPSRRLQADGAILYKEKNFDGTLQHVYLSYFLDIQVANIQVQMLGARKYAYIAFESYLRKSVHRTCG